MPRRILDAYGIEDPASHSERVNSSFLFALLFLPFAAWIVQLIVSYGLATYACFPSEMARDSLLPGWGFLGAVLVAINLLALAITLLTALASFLVWRHTSEEAGGGHGHLIEAGEGRTRFLAVWGIWLGIWFALQIIFGTIAIIGVPACGG